MKLIWSYLLMALCATMTSARIMDYPGNRLDFHGNLVSGIKDEKVLTPPTDGGLIIDSNGYPGNSNEAKIEDFEGLPFDFNQVLTAILSQGINSQYDIIPFSKEDITKMQDSGLCKTMCENGVKKPPCKCE